MDFLRIDSQNRTILFVEFLDLEIVLSRLDHIVVDLVPPSKGCNFRPGNVSEGMEIKSVDASEDYVGCECGGDDLYKSGLVQEVEVHFVDVYPLRFVPIGLYSRDHKVQ